MSHPTKTGKPPAKGLSNGNRIKLIIVCAAAAVGGFMFGYDTSVINSAVKALTSPDSGFGVTGFMSGFTVSSALVGCAVGAWFAGKLADRYGRTKVLIGASILFVACALVSGLTSNVWVFFIFRFLGGIGVGFTSVIGPSYISEIAPQNLRGMLGSMQQFAIVLGQIAALGLNDLYAMGAGGAEKTWWLGLAAWRWMLMTMALPGILMFVVALMLPESPRYLVMKGENEKARTILSEITGEPDPDDKVQEIRGTMLERPARLSDLRGDCFGLRKVMWVAIGVAMLQQLQGTNVIMFYDSSMWQMVGFSEQSALHMSFIRTIFALIATMIGMAYIDKIGRRKLLTIGSVTMTIGLALMAVGFFTGKVVNGEVNVTTGWAWFLLIVANVFWFCYTATWAPGMWVVISEVLPNSIRAIGVSVATFFCWIASAACNWVFPSMRDGIGLGWSYVIFALFGVVGFLLVTKALPETSGVALEDMSEN